MTCEYCRRGEENLLRRSPVHGLTVNGGYAEYLAAPADLFMRCRKICAAETRRTPTLRWNIGYRVLAYE